MSLRFNKLKDWQFYIDKIISAGGELLLGNNTDISGTLSILEDVSMHQNLLVSKSITCDSSLHVHGDTSLNSRVDIGNNLKVLGTISSTDITCDNLTMTGIINGPSTLIIDPAGLGDNTGIVIIKGGLQVDGHTTTINSSILDISDRTILLASNATNQAQTYGSGIEISGNKTFKYVDGDIWESNIDLSAAGITTGILRATNIDLLGDITTNNINLGGHIIPVLNKQYDIGSPNRQIRDIYLSSSTLYMGTDIEGEVKPVLKTVGGNLELTGELIGDISLVNYVVTVASKTANHPYPTDPGVSSSLGYFLNGLLEAPTLLFEVGKTYRFKQDDSSNYGHPIRFYNDSGRTSPYSTKVSYTSASAGSADSYSEIFITPQTANVLYYQCGLHGYMGGKILISNYMLGTDTSGNVSITGNLTISGNTFPDNKGVNGQILSTDGNGSLSWINPSISAGSGNNNTAPYHSLKVYRTPKQNTENLDISQYIEPSGQLVFVFRDISNAKYAHFDKPYSVNITESYFTRNELILDLSINIFRVCDKTKYGFTVITSRINSSNISYEDIAFNLTVSTSNQIISEMSYYPTRYLPNKKTIVNTHTINITPEATAGVITGYAAMTGGEILGQYTGDQAGSGLAMSADGTIMAIGSRYHSNVGVNRGHVRVYRRNDDNTGWNQMGTNINGESDGDEFGFSVAMTSDGTRIAVSSPMSNSGNGNVRVYDWYGNTWTPQSQAAAFAGFNGNGGGSGFGIALAMSGDGAVIALGNSNYNNRGGRVRVLEWNGSAWSIRGTYINDPENNFSPNPAHDFGFSIGLSDDGTNIVVGSRYNNDYNGAARVYNYNGSAWTQVGSDILGVDAHDYSGYSVTMNANGTIIGVCARGRLTTYRGSARVYQLNNSEWGLLGSEIFGENDSDYFGTCSTMNADGTIIAISAPYNDGGGNASGHVRIYKWNGTTWDKLGNDIDGDAPDDSVGGQTYPALAMSADGTVIALGASLNDNNGTDSGHVRTYKATVAVQAPRYKAPDLPIITISGEFGNSGEFPTISGDFLQSVAGDSSIIDIITTGFATPNNSSAVPSVGSVQYIELWSDNSLNSADNIEALCDVADISYVFNNKWVSGNIPRGREIYHTVMARDYLGQSTKITVTYEKAPGLPAGYTEWGDGVLSGEANYDQFGGYYEMSLALSPDGQTLAVGADQNAGPDNTNYTHRGHVRVFTRTSTGWVQKGADIDAPLTGPGTETPASGSYIQYGHQVDINTDGTILAVGAYSGAYVQVLKWNGAVWEQMGQRIISVPGFLQVGHQVKLGANGLMLVISAFDAGLLRAYDYSVSQNQWVMRGESFGAGSGWFGFTLAVSADGTTIAAAKRTVAASAGAIVYKWDGTAWADIATWVSTDLINPSPSGYEWRVALNADGTIIGISDYATDVNFNNTGVVRMFQWNGNANWPGYNAMGSVITGPHTGATYGTELSISNDGKLLAISGHTYSSNNGFAPIYMWNGTEWNPLPAHASSSPGGGYYMSLISGDGKTLISQMGGADTDGTIGTQRGRLQTFLQYNTEAEALVPSGYVQLGADIYGSGPGVLHGFNTKISGDGLTILAISRNYATSTNPEAHAYRWDGDGWVPKGNLNQALSDAMPHAMAFEGLGINHDGSRVLLSSLSATAYVFDYNATSATGWEPVGQTIISVTIGIAAGSGLRFRFAELSADGTRVALGTDSYATRMFVVLDYSAGTNLWALKGTPIEESGTNGGGNSWGTSIGMSADGAVVAHSNEATPGRVRAYTFVGNDWALRGTGNDLMGDSAHNSVLFGRYHFTLSGNGSRIAMGGPLSDPAGNSNAGYGQVFEWDGATWSKLGQAFTSEYANDGMGASMVLSVDGMTLAVGARSHPNSNNPVGGGYVDVYVWNNSALPAEGWVKLAQLTGDKGSLTNPNPNYNNDYFAAQVAMSADGSVIIAAGRENDGASTDNNNNVGHVRAFVRRGV